MTNQMNISNKTGDEMNEAHKEILRKHHKYIIQNLSNPADICDALIEKDIINLGNKQEILAKRPAPHAQIRHLLSLIPRRGKNAFEAFIESLREEGNEDLVEKLSGTTNPVVEKKPPAPPEIKETKWPESTELIKEIIFCKEDDPNLSWQGSQVYNMTKENSKGFILFKNVIIDGEKLNKPLQNKIDHDCTNLDQVLKLANFKKICYKQNKTIEQTKEILEKETTEKKMKDIDCLFLVFFSVSDNPLRFHGTKECCLEFEEIHKLLNSRPALKSKPKIVLIQCYCKDTWENCGGKGDQVDGEGDQVDAAAEMPGDSEKYASTYINEDDLFIVCAKPETGEGPWVKGENFLGSWFIQAFAHVFKEHAHEMSFLDMLDKVDSLLRNAWIEEEKKKKKVAEVKILTKCTKKKLYFFPGIKNQPVKSLGDSVKNMSCSESSGYQVSQDGATAYNADKSGHQVSQDGATGCSTDKSGQQASDS